MINIIAAIGKNRELGRDNKLLWHIPKDMERFKKLTSGQIAIMGRKTYESLPEKFRPLPNRVNIIVTRDANYMISGTTVCHSVEEAIQQAKTIAGKETFIIGGAQIYAQSIKYADKLFLTLVDKEYPDADAFFPDYSQFKKVISEEAHNSGDLHFKFIEIVK